MDAAFVSTIVSLTALMLPLRASTWATAVRPVIHGTVIVTGTETVTLTGIGTMDGIGITETETAIATVMAGTLGGRTEATEIGTATETITVATLVTRENHGETNEEDLRLGAGTVPTTEEKSIVGGGAIAEVLLEEAALRARLLNVPPLEVPASTLQWPQMPAGRCFQRKIQVSCLQCGPRVRLLVDSRY